MMLSLTSLHLKRKIILIIFLIIFVSFILLQNTEKINVNVHYKNFNVQKNNLTTENNSVEENNSVRLLIGCDHKRYERYVLKEFYYLFGGLITKYGWIEVPAEVINNLFQNKTTLISNKTVPDVLMFCEGAIDYLTKQTAANLLELNPNIKFAFWCEDFHMKKCNKNEQRMVEIFSLIHVILGSYAYKFFDYFRLQLSNFAIDNLPDIVWIPHSASPEFVEDIYFNDSPKPDILLSGSIDPMYPMRQWLYINKDMIGNIHVYNHPGYFSLQPLNQSKIFAKAIQSHMASFTCGSTFVYAIAKTFEIPATGSLLLMNNKMNLVLKSLGMIPHVHYVNYSDESPAVTLQWVLNPLNRKEIDKIRLAGMKLIRNSHLTEFRTDAIQSYFNTGKKVFPLPRVYKL